MLKRIYIDNYKSLVNLEITLLNPISLFIGLNGSGKSAIFEVLQNIRSFVRGDSKAPYLFTYEKRTKWQNLPFQTFELEIEGKGGIFKYELSIEHDEFGAKSRVAYERLLFNQKPLLRFENGEVQLYRDNHSEGPEYPFDWSQSAVASILPRRDNTLMTWFKETLSSLIIVHPVPTQMDALSDDTTTTPSFLMDDFASWYRYLSQDQGMTVQLIEALRNILPGFDYFKLEQESREYRLLQVFFKTGDNSQSVGYDFDELSDGQRMLIALYTLIYASKSSEHNGYVLCLDEPENFVALPEIQPWLIELYDRCNEGHLQVLLVSHHPELLNYLLESPGGYWFERLNNGPTRIRSIQSSGENGLPASELLTRGWLVDE